MQKKFKFFVMALVAMIAACAMTACDSDNVDELTDTIWGKTWVSAEGEIYDFYKSFSGVIYADRNDYKEHKIDKSFVWTVIDSRLTFAVDGYRQDNGEWKELASSELQPTVYDVTAEADKLTLKSDGQTLVLTKLAE